MPLFCLYRYTGIPVPQQTMLGWNGVPSSVIWTRHYQCGLNFGGHIFVTWYLCLWWAAVHGCTGPVVYAFCRQIGLNPECMSWDMWQQWSDCILWQGHLQVSDTAVLPQVPRQLFPQWDFYWGFLTYQISMFMHRSLRVWSLHRVYVHSGMWTTQEVQFHADLYGGITQGVVAFIFYNACSCVCSDWFL